MSNGDCNSNKNNCCKLQCEQLEIDDEKDENAIITNTHPTAISSNDVITTTVIIGNTNKFNEYSIAYIDIVLTIISILLRMGTVLLNIILAYEYYTKNKYNYFAWTIMCILVPMIVTTMICVTIYLNDSKNANNRRRRKHGFFGFIWFIILMPFLFRYCQSLMYAIESKAAEKRNDKENQKKFFEFMIQEESDVALVRIFECFLEAAPQKVLQISIILSGEDKITWMQFAAIFGCLGSMTWSIVVYHKYNRYLQSDKEKICIYGVIMQCLWHFFIAVSRILSISSVASLFPMWTLYGCIIHALFMGTFVFYYDNPTFCSNTNIFYNFTFSLILGIIYVFTYITVKDGPTRYRFIFYYFICILEIIICLILFINYSNVIVKNSNYFIPLCISSIVPYFMGIFCMILYYTTFHPNIISRNMI